MRIEPKVCPKDGCGATVAIVVESVLRNYWLTEEFVDGTFEYDDGNDDVIWDTSAPVEDEQGLALVMCSRYHEWRARISPDEG